MVVVRILRGQTSEWRVQARRTTSGDSMKRPAILLHFVFRSPLVNVMARTGHVDAINASSSSSTTREKSLLAVSMQDGWGGVWC